MPDIDDDDVVHDDILQYRPGDLYIYMSFIVMFRRKFVLIGKRTFRFGRRWHVSALWNVGRVEKKERGIHFASKNEELTSSQHGRYVQGA